MKRRSLNISLGILFILILIYFIYKIIGGNNTVDYIASIISVSLLSLFILVFIAILIKNKKISSVFLIANIILIIFISFNLLYDIGIIQLPKQATVKDFFNQTITEALKWAEKNEITLNITYENSDTVEPYNIIRQDIIPGILTKKIKEINIVVSDGPDYEKTVTIPSMIGWSIEEVIIFVEENHLNNIVVDFVTSVNEKDSIISQNSSGNMKRNDYLYLTASIGEEMPTESISMINLKNKSTFYASVWLKRNGIKYELKFDYSDKVLKDHVINQNILQEKMVNPVSDIVTLTISKGKQIVVPNLLNMTIEKITQWVINNRLKITFNDQYHESIALGNIVSINYQKGDILEEGTFIIIVVSKGKLMMPKFNTALEFKEWAEKYNIPYQENYQFDKDFEQGKIIKITPKIGDVIKEGDTINIYISHGAPVTVPNFVGKSKTVITNECRNLDISCNFIYGSYTDNIAKDIATNQSKNPGSEIVKGSNISITLSKGIIEKTNVPNLIGLSKSSAENACKSAGIICVFTIETNYSSAPINQVKYQSLSAGSKVVTGSKITVTLSKGPAQTFHNIIIQETWIVGGNPTGTKNEIQKNLTRACPDVNFNFQFKEANSGVGTLTPDSPIKVGVSYSFTQGQTYTIIIGN